MGFENSSFDYCACCGAGDGQALFVVLHRTEQKGNLPFKQIVGIYDNRSAAEEVLEQAPATIRSNYSICEYTLNTRSY